MADGGFARGLVAGFSVGREFAQAFNERAQRTRAQEIASQALAEIQKMEGEHAVEQGQWEELQDRIARGEDVSEEEQLRVGMRAVQSGFRAMINAQTVIAKAIATDPENPFLQQALAPYGERLAEMQQQMQEWHMNQVQMHHRNIVREDEQEHEFSLQERRAADEMEARRFSADRADARQSRADARADARLERRHQFELEEIEARGIQDRLTQRERVEGSEDEYAGMTEELEGQMLLYDATIKRALRRGDRDTAARAMLAKEVLLVAQEEEMLKSPEEISAEQAQADGGEEGGGAFEHFGEMGKFTTNPLILRPAQVLKLAGKLAASAWNYEHPEHKKRHTQKEVEQETAEERVERIAKERVAARLKTGDLF